MRQAIFFENAAANAADAVTEPAAAAAAAANE